VTEAAQAPSEQAPQNERRPALGYAMVTGAAILFAVNGTVAKIVLATGISSFRLAEIRSAGALLGLALVVALTRPHAFRTTRRELPYLVLFGICGVALVQLLYFLAIRRLPVGIALLIEYLAPLLVALWARFGAGETVGRRIWAALALCLAGLSLVVDIWQGVSLNGTGVAFALLGAVSLAVYLLLAERSVAGRDSLSLLAYGFLFASLLWAAVQPWWSFPTGIVAGEVSLLGRFDASLPVWSLLVVMVLLGTMAPFALIVGSLRHLSATRVGIVAMLEPVAGAIVAYAWLGETLGGVQLAGGAIVLAGIFLAQTARDTSTDD
jgi:drug/metabolite transporter (DMT)-like permease